MVDFFKKIEAKLIYALGQIKSIYIWFIVLLFWLFHSPIRDIYDNSEIEILKQCIIWRWNSEWNIDIYVCIYHCISKKLNEELHWWYLSVFWSSLWSISIYISYNSITKAKMTHLTNEKEELNLVILSISLNKITQFRYFWAI